MRHQSQRVPEKNYRLLGSKPLFHYIIEALLACAEIDQIVVDTDSPPVMEGLRQHFPQVIVIERPEHLRADATSMNECCCTTPPRSKAISTCRPTPPILLRPRHCGGAVRTFLDGYPAYDSLLSVTRWQTRLWDQLGRAINHNPSILLQTQDLPPVYEENSCIYIFTRQTLVARRNRLGERPYLFEIDAAEAWDIDEELDFEIVDFLMKKGIRQG
jgi:CMP-N-acetylneuraminic acid synthetase